jgi:glycosyltransferase involved in cell wall biosynthesis
MVETQTFGAGTLLETKPLVIVGIPAFNEENTISGVIVECMKFAHIIIVCDDGSADSTADIAEKLGAITIRHDKNVGKGQALRSIFEACVKFNPDVIVTIDADGQHDPQEIPQLIKPIVNGESDVILGNRYLAPLSYKIPLYRRVGLHFINWLGKKAHKSNISDSQNGFRAYNAKALKVISLFESNGFSVESEQIILAQKAGLRIEEVAVSTKYEGLYRTSKKSPLTHGLGLIGYLLKVIVEDRPLVFLGIPGIVSLLIGLSFVVWMFEIYSIEHNIVTNIALASVAFTLIGIFAVFASITLYSISRMSQKLTNK